MQPEKRNTLGAVGLFIALQLGNAIMASIAFWLVSARAGYSPFQVVFFYSAGGLACLLPWALAQRKKLRRPHFKLYLLRAVFEYGGFILSFYALRYLDLPKQNALGFVGPLFGTLLAIRLLKEKSYLHTWLSLLLGFAGVAIITRPGSIPLNPGVGYALLSALAFAFCSIFIKRLTASESSRHIAFYMLGLTTLIALPLALAHWKMPSPAVWCWLAAFGVIAWAQQVAVAAAIARLPLVTLMPLNFMRLVFVSILSYFLYAQVIDRWTLFGAAVILAAAVYDAWATTVKAKKIHRENPL